MDINVIINQMIVLFFGMAVGYAANKLKIMTAEGNKMLSSLVVKVCLPFYIVASVLNGEHTLSGGMVFGIIGYSLISNAIAALIAVAVTKLPCFNNKDRRLYSFMIMFGNVGFMGMPVVSSIFGNDALFYASVFNMPFNFLVYSLGIYFVSGGSGKVEIKPRMLINSGTVASIISIALYLLDIRLPSVLCTAISSIGQITTPAAMLVIGSTLAGVPVKNIFRDKELYLIVVVRLLVVPIAVWAVQRLILPDATLLGVGVMLAAMPVATNASMLCLQYNGNHELASNCVFISTVLSVVTIPILSWLLL